MRNPGARNAAGCRSVGVRAASALTPVWASILPAAAGAVPNFGMPVAVLPFWAAVEPFAPDWAAFRAFCTACLTASTYFNAASASATRLPAVLAALSCAVFNAADALANVVFAV